MARMNPKKRAEQHSAYLEQMKYQMAGKLGERYPKLRMLSFEFKYHDPDGMVQDSTQRMAWGPDQQALFEFKCPYWECVSGGHDLGAPIRAMLQDSKAELSGKLACQGWQDQERVGKHRCWCELTYTIKAEYV